MRFCVSVLINDSLLLRPSMFTLCTSRVTMAMIQEALLRYTSVYKPTF